MSNNSVNPEKYGRGYLFNAHGKIGFPDHLKIAEFQILEFDRKVDDIKKTQLIEKFINSMKSHWNLELPDCILSLTGAALDFEEDYKKALETVKKYLNEIINASKNTWIITGGSNKGVMRLAGEIVKNSDKKVVCLGIGTFGKVKIAQIIKKSVRGNNRDSKEGLNVEQIKKPGYCWY